MSLKLAPSGMVIGAYGTPAYLSLTYLMQYFGHFLSERVNKRGRELVQCGERIPLPLEPVNGLCP